MIGVKGEAHEILRAKQQAKTWKEKQKVLKEQLQDEHDKEKLQCSVCKRMIQRNCMSEHKKHLHVKIMGYY